MLSASIDRLVPFDGRPYAHAAVALVVLALVAWATNWLMRHVLLRVLGRVLQRLTGGGREALHDHGVLRRLANIVPAVVVWASVQYMPDLAPEVRVVVGNVALAFLAVAIALALSHLLDAVNDWYLRTRDRAHERPIKGYVQMAKIVVFAIAAVVAVATLVDRSPWLLLSGFGALSAVLLLVFKDSILSLVASIQLSTNDMVRVGDWIEMPALDANGHVIDMALNTVKVQNWDKTITTIPTYRLMSESFRNWRGMQESGARRIKRALLIDQSSVRFLDASERDALRAISLIDDYLERKCEELAEHNERLEAAGRHPVNTRRVTNLGTFRAYACAYLRAHPRVDHDLMCMMRQLEPGPTGLPLEVYCFTVDTGLADFEATQADIFDHLLAVLPAFDLRLYQQPGGADVAAFLEGRGARVGEA
ncbi:mechanosensitive ion channel family protein [Cognatilysobacter bugurensis]|uniref:Mechanosensing system component YbdG n=1 Tax=Cognatilysobacter bugurensis TaxID=543356 RepID=A0A918T0R1_9GAMM|nr:mechanosensitive ion channel domain-containing protein [Lysobacter bugurensis]GHA83405.1 mechanosensitive ion channel protein MscS [Lysobacter bugurensis]